MKLRVIGGVLILLAIAIMLGLLYQNSQKRQQTIVFSPKFMLSALWDTYKKHYWEADTGRTLDRQRDGITTSEGQSYTLLRAVWLDDRQTYDKTWQWTRTNLKKPDSNLFSWLYGKRADGSLGILSARGGQNSAADADTDIAVSLLLASARWGDENYLQQAKAIINDIWNNEVITINSTPYLAADDIEKAAPSTVIVNPSYFAPYAYKMFAQIDAQHDWNRLAGSCYGLLQKSQISALDKNISAGLPPDWLALDKKTGRLAALPSSTLTTNYGFDAMRIPFRLALDWEWFKDPRAKDILSRMYFLNQEWESKKILLDTYSHDGSALTNEEAPSFYGGSLGYFSTIKPQSGEDLYKNKLQSLYSSDFQDWKKPMSYYDDNWAWFGLALYNHLLVNLTAQQ